MLTAFPITAVERVDLGGSLGGCCCCWCCCGVEPRRIRLLLTLT